MVNNLKGVYENTTPSARLVLVVWKIGELSVHLYLQDMMALEQRMDPT
jgi:hypothetical protein